MHRSEMMEMGLNRLKIDVEGLETIGTNLNVHVYACETLFSIKNVRQHEHPPQKTGKTLNIIL